MPSNLRDDDDNPFAPPTAGIGERAADVPETIPEAEAIRRANIGRETAVRAIGYLNYGLAAAFGILGLMYLIAVVLEGLARSTNLDAEAPDRERSWASFLAPFVVPTIGFTFFGVVGRGLRRLRTWSRWTMIGLASLGLVVLLYGGSVDVANAEFQEAALLFGLSTTTFGLILYVMASPRGRRVFSGEYQTIIALTPHVKNRTSTTTKVVTLVLIAASIAGAVYLLGRG